jgi:regulator of replication initiation timing
VGVSDITSVISFLKNRCESAKAALVSKMQTENTALDLKNTKLWHTLIAVADALGIDTENPFVVLGTPSDVFVSRINALKEENERLKFEADSMMVAIKSAAHENTSLKARVAELEAQKARIKSAGTYMSNICYNVSQCDMSQWSERLPDGQVNVLRDAYQHWDAAIKDPSNEA